VTITGFKYGNMLDPDTFRRKDRFLFDLPIKHDGIKIHDLAEQTGFNFYQQLIDLGIPLDTYNGTELGDVWTYEDEESYTTWHGIVSFSADASNGYTGYHPGSYQLLVPALDKLYEEVEGEWTRSARSVMLGHGEYHGTGLGIFRNGYDFAWNHELGMAVLANTEFEVDVWSTDVPELIAEQY
jgi:hypothetical protein